MATVGNSSVSPADYKALQDRVASQEKALDNMAKGIKTLTDWAAKQPKAGTHPSQVFGVPNVRNGESSMTSRGFSFMKMLGVLAGYIPEEEAKVETKEISAMLTKAVGAGVTNGYDWSKGSRVGQRYLAPLSTAYLPDNEHLDHNMRRTIKGMINAGMDHADPDEMRWIRQQQFKSLGYGQKTLSWLTEHLGGALVAPPEQGELIELLRNKEALINAGAKTVPLPPQGRMVYPRQTAASTTYWVGENKRINDSDIGVGEVTLQAKKLAVLIKSPNELIRFASPAAEALMREDMTKSLALALDLACLEGEGGDVKPRGLINHPNINIINATTQSGTGDTVVGEDIYRAIAIVEEFNAEFEGWIMRPKLLYKFYQLRAAAIAAGDKQGPFLFNIIREAGDGVATPLLAGYPVTKSTQVSQSRVKGSGTGLTYLLGGMFSDCLIGMFGAIEFAANAMGDTPFQFDQTWVRGILSADFAVRHESAFSMVDNLDVRL